MVITLFSSLINPALHPTAFHPVPILLKVFPEQQLWNITLGLSLYSESLNKRTKVMMT